MRYSRQNKIIEIINNYEVDTQEKLASLLKEEGYEVAQATISRDIKELQLVKVLLNNGKYCYALGSSRHIDAKSNIESLFSTSVISVDYAENLVVVKTVAGMAQAVCTAIDAAAISGVLGTIAGDDTIFLAAKTAEKAAEITSELRVISIYENNSENNY